RLDIIECVTPRFFDVMGSRPFLGRAFDDADGRPSASPTIVLSYRFWRELGGSNGMVGSSLTINDTPVTVIGVMPRGFDGSRSRAEVQGWLPLDRPIRSRTVTGCRSGRDVNVIGRIDRSLSIAEAERRLPQLHLSSLVDDTLEDVRTPFLAL